MVKSKINCGELTDSEILTKSLRDLDFFRCIYERYEQQLKKYINKISGFDQDEVEDILQNSFIKLWKNINSYDQSMKFSSFLYRIVHNETISYWRKINSKYQNEYSYFSETSNFEDLDIEEPYPSKINQIKKVLNVLPLKYKEILILKFLENMDYEEISDILKIPEGTVATRINRAKKAFKKIAGEKNLIDELINK